MNANVQHRLDRILAESVAAEIERLHAKQQALLDKLASAADDLTQQIIAIADDIGVLRSIGASDEELPPGEFAGWKIQYGFQHHDLHPGDGNQYNTPAAADWYGDALEDAVKAEYPGATVEIREGWSVPQGWIVTPPANTSEALVLQIDIILNMEEIDERVFDSIPWADYDIG